MREKFLFFNRIKSTSIIGYPIGSTWQKHELKHENTSKQKVNAKFITKQEQKQETQRKLGCLPTSAIV